MDRRRFLTGVVTASVVVGFDTVSRRWIGTAEVSAATFTALPDLDGLVVMDDAALDAVSTDEGNIVHRRPWAILRPGSVDDIAAMVQYCRLNGLQLAARGQGHTVFGQSLVEAGLIVETRWLSTIHTIESGQADVDAGVRWTDLLAATVEPSVSPAARPAHPAKLPCAGFGD